MALSYRSLSKKPRVFRQLTTLTIQEFETLAGKLKPEWERREYERKSAKPNRINKVGQGHPYFGDFPTLLLLLVMYERTSCSHVLLTLLFGIREQTIYEIIPKLLPLLHDRFIPETQLTKKRKPRGRINTLDDLIAAYPEIKSVITDGTDILTRRPKRRQKKNYSGKSKKHCKKAVLVVNASDGIILGRTGIRPGSVHDKRVLDEDALHGMLDRDEKITKRADSAWTGEDPELGWLVNKRGRRNHPLTDDEKKQNRKLSKIRIRVEHAIRRVKVFRRIGEKTAFRVRGRIDQTLQVAINLANFKQLMRHPLTA